MSNELMEKCTKYNISGEAKDFLINIENLYNVVAESEKEDTEKQMTMCEWVEDNTNIEELKKLTEEQKFFFGLGVLSSELMNQLE